MSTKLLIKGKGKIKCRMHLVQVCIRLADVCNWTNINTAILMSVNTVIQDFWKIGGS